MKKANKEMLDKRNNILYFVNNLMCGISSMVYMFYISIISISIFPVVHNTKGLNDDILLETIVEADMFIIRNFFMLLVITILFYVINYIFYRKKKEKLLWGLVIISSLSLIINIIRVLMIYV